MKISSLNVNVLKRPVVLITVGAVILAAILWWFLWMQPEGNKLNTVDAQESQLTSQLSTLNQQIAADKAQAAKVQQYAGYLDTFSAAVPPIAEAPQLTTELAALANKTGVRLQNLSDDTTSPGTGSELSTIPITMLISGSRQECLRFLQGIYTASLIPRLVTVSAFQPTPQQGGGNSNVLTPSQRPWTATIDATAYFDAAIGSGTSTTATTTSSTSTP